jgi:hypothetical protein
VHIYQAKEDNVMFDLGGGRGTPQIKRKEKIGFRGGCRCFYWAKSVK